MKANDIEQTMSEYTNGDKVPTQYCHLYKKTTGEQWIYPLTDEQTLSANHHGRKMVAHLLRVDYYDVLLISPDLPFRTFGVNYTATVYTDGRAPGSSIFWDSCEMFATLQEAK